LISAAFVKSYLSALLHLSKASKLFASGKKIRWKIEGVEYCLYADDETVFPDELKPLK